jgi:surfactin synthase thioesterase subunit
VSAFAGDSDPEVDRSELSAWRHITSGEFRSRLFSGDHFYLKGAPQHLLVEIRDELRQDLTLRSWMVAGA